MRASFIGADTPGLPSVLPSKRRISRIVTVGETAVLFQAHWTTASRWSRRVESLDPSWLTMPLGPFVIAFRFS